MSEGHRSGGSGRCMCGDISYSVAGPMRDALYCHCTECQRSSGFIWAASAAYRDMLAIDDPHGRLTWYASSEHARRGFCARCGSSLFYETNHAPESTSIAMGSLDTPTGLKARGHIFLSEKSDYFDLGDGLPQFEGDSDGAVRLPTRDDGASG